MTGRGPKVPLGTPLPPRNTILWVRVAHQGQDHRLGPIQCARSVTCEDVQGRLRNRFGLHKERYEIIWVDDDNNQSVISDDVSLYDAMEFFTPAAASSAWTPASSKSPVSPASSEGGSNGSGSSSGTTMAQSSNAAAAVTAAPIEVHIQIRVFSSITLSDFAPSSGGSASGLDDQGSSWGSEIDYEHRNLHQYTSDGFSAYETDAASTNGHHLWRERVSEGGSRQGTSQLNGQSTPRNERQGTNPSELSSGRSSGSRVSRPPLNGKQRLASLQSFSDDLAGGDEGDSDEDDDQGTEYAFSGESVAIRRLFEAPSSSAKEAREGASGIASLSNASSSSLTALHKGISCVVCGAYPIRGVRYMCVMCNGLPSFCGRCEDSGQSIQHAPHLATHALLRLVEPMPTLPKEQDTETISLASILTHAASTLAISDHMTVSGVPPLGLSNEPTSVPNGHDVLCSFCSEQIVDGPRYLCANCPLDLPTPMQGHPATDGVPESVVGEVEAGTDPLASSGSLILTPHEGYNLCSACEEHSLSIHNSDHFFLKIPGMASMGRSTSAQRSVTPLRLNPYLMIEHRTQGLLPTLYQDEDPAWLVTQSRIIEESAQSQTSGSSRSSSTVDTPTTEMTSGQSVSEFVASPAASASADAAATASATGEGSDASASGSTQPLGVIASFLRRRAPSQDAEEMARRRQLQESRMGVDDLILAGEQNRDAQFGASPGSSNSAMRISPPPPWTPPPPAAAPASSTNDGVAAPASPQEGGTANGGTSPPSVRTIAPTYPPSTAAPIVRLSSRPESHALDYVRTLRHASLMCDVCYQSIQGCWLRCANCRTSFDVCSRCEHEATTMHEPEHTFAVFKRRVDLDLFKSLVDHVDSQADPHAFGPSRAMIPFPLV